MRAPSETYPLLEIREITKSFPGVRALKGVSLDIRAGEVHALLGENGAGKSTLMHILAGVYPPDEGVLRLQGREVRFAHARAAQEAGIAMVFQERSLAGPVSVAENVFFGRQPANRWGVIDRVLMRRKTSEILAELEINLHPDMVVEDLSPAEQQMVEIAKALSLDAKLLVLDEPTSTLTETETSALFRVVVKLRNRGVGIVYISHRMREVFQICDRITVLRDGEYQGTFNKAEATEEQLIGRMVGREFRFRAHTTARAAQTGALALEVKGLGDADLLKEIGFSARAGEITALAGLAGSGRTELAMTIFGARPAVVGQVLVNGRLTAIRSPLEAVRAGIGYVPEDRKEAGLFLDMGVAANFGASRLDRYGGWWVNDAAMERDAFTVGARLHLAPNTRDRAVGELSGGNQQKVMLSRWLLEGLSVLIVDEPTRGIDIGAKMEVHQVLRDLAREGLAIVLISSELPEVLSLADRIFVMREGRIAGILSPAEASEEAILRLAALPHAAH